MGMLGEDEIYNILKDKDLNKSPEITNKSTPLIKALWVLDVVKGNMPGVKVTVKTTHFLLWHLKGITESEIALRGALNKARDNVRKTSEENKIYFEISQAGRDYLRQSTIHSSNGFLFIDGTNAWTATNQNFPELINSLGGELLIVDPYYGYGTFHTLSKFDKSKKIRFLTNELGASETRNKQQFDLQLKTFRSEFKNIDLRQYPKGYELHDRYILAEGGLVIIGQGIKDLGNKESFIVFLPKETIGSLLTTLKSKFEERWKSSKSLA